ncbi:hypothetical protein [uncultured Sphingomonas sp.]|uniref:hypothetical protein n=1 Tax=uncultured Sphingomonas sp. TaxID=158754 RepID=UPI002609BF43|nr:hypothetical protein [uncultured Sphingomonas sp.]
MAEIINFPDRPRYRPDEAVVAAIATLKQQAGGKLDGNVIVEADAVSLVLLYVDDTVARLNLPPSGAA